MQDEWTDEDRLKVITSLSTQLAALCQHRGFPVACTFETSERIALVASQSQEFLKANRMALLQGNHIATQD
jgi:hypothetical protein